MNALPPRGRAMHATASRWRLLVFAFCGLHALFPIVWLLTVWRTGPTPNDWLHLKIVAEHFVAGDLSSLYAMGERAINPGYLWRYPPFALYAVAPLAWLTRPWAYAVVAAVGIALLLLSMRLLSWLAPQPEYKAEWVVAALFSAPAFSSLVTGQHSAVIVLVVVVAGLLWSKGHSVAAAAVLGLLAFKPNWLVYFVLMLIVLRQWRGLTALIGVALLLAASSLPLGFRLWVDFFAISTANAQILSSYEGYKLITLRGFLGGVVSSSAVAAALLFAAWCALVPTAVVAWRSSESPIWKLGVTLLLAVALNPYASFYDALLLVVPATVLWSQAKRWRPTRFRLVSLLIVVAWTGEHMAFSWPTLLGPMGLDLQPQVSTVGPVCALWLLLEASEARHRSCRLRQATTDGRAASGRECNPEDRSESAT